MNEISTYLKYVMLHSVSQLVSEFFLPTLNLYGLTM